MERSWWLVLCCYRLKTNENKGVHCVISVGGHTFYHDHGAADMQFLRTIFSFKKRPFHDSACHIYVFVMYYSLATPDERNNPVMHSKGRLTTQSAFKVKVYQRQLSQPNILWEYDRRNLWYSITLTGFSWVFFKHYCCKNTCKHCKNDHLRS